MMGFLQMGGRDDDLEWLDSRVRTLLATPNSKHSA